MKLKYFTIFVLLTFLFSCKTRPKEESTLNYMQNIEQIATKASMDNSALNSTIQVGDQLVIYVTAKDMDVVKPFNQNYSSSETLVSQPASGNVASTGQMSISGPTYIVDSSGYIDFPVLGKLKTSGKTIVDFKEEIREKLTEFIKNPSVAIKLANYRITVLGEVNRPGSYVITDGHSTILNAIGLAGDLTMYGKRDDVLIVRNEDGQILKERINLKDASFINSPYYNLKQGDVIFVSSSETKEKTSKLDPKTGIYISIASVSLGLLGIFITLFKK